MKATPKSRAWDAEVEGSTVLLALSGDWVARTDGVDLGIVDQPIKPGVRVLKFDTVKLGHWDSGLIAVLAGLREAANKDGVLFDEEGLPGPARRLLQLLSKPPVKARTQPRANRLDRIGLWAIAAWAEGVEDAALVGNMLLRGAAALTGRAAIQASDLVEAVRRSSNATAVKLPLAEPVHHLSARRGFLPVVYGVTPQSWRNAPIHASCSSRRRGPSKQVLTRPTFSVETSPACSKT